MTPPLRAYVVPLLAAVVLLAIGARARAADEPRIPCWQIHMFLASHNGDRAAARNAARARGATEGQIADAQRRCDQRAR